MWSCSIRRPASTSPSGISGNREHRYRSRMAIHVTVVDASEVQELAEVAARTFPLACPPSVTPENISSFIDENLCEARFLDYLADPDRIVVAAHDDERMIGYALLICGVPDDDDV